MLPQIEYHSTSSRNLEAKGRLDFAKSLIMKLCPSILAVTDYNFNSLLHHLFALDNYRYKLEVFQLIVGFCTEKGHLRSMAFDEEIMLVQLLSIRNEFGQTPIHRVLGDYDNELLLKTVLTALNGEKLPPGSCNPLLIKDIDGETPLHYACKGGLECMEILLGFHWTDSYQDSLIAINMEDTSGALPIDHAISSCLSDTISEDKIPPEIEEKWPEDERLRLEYNIFPDLVDYVHDHGLDCPFSQALLSEFQLLWAAIKIILVTTHKVLQMKQSTKSPPHMVSSINIIPASVLKMTYLFTAGDDLTFDGSGLLPIHIAASSPKFPSSYRKEGLSPLWQSELEPRSMIEYMLERDPTVATLVTSSGQLPLHLAISAGQSMEKEIFPLIHASPLSVSIRDPLTSLYPYLLAATTNTGETLYTIYSLLILDPSILGN